MGVPGNITDDVQDVVIIGAGISGVNAAYRIQTELPGSKYIVLEGRNAIGGTWDLFRYPGIRSDSDLHTFAFDWRPWRHERAIAGGELIREYVKECAQWAGIDKHILFNHKVQHASWSSDKQLWTITVLADGAEERTYYTRFIYWCSGYYNYEKPLPVTIPGLEHFKGTIIHPQFWPEDLDYTGKKVIVIGSGATAITLLPSLADKAASVTMVQRSPTYIISQPAVDPQGAFLRRWFPFWFYRFIIRMKFLWIPWMFYNFCRTFPNAARFALRQRTRRELPKSIPHDPHFVPPYNPWEQRLCLTPDGEFYQALRKGDCAMVTGVIDTVTENGVVMKSGERVEGDIIVTATGLQIQVGGGSTMVVDGKSIDVGSLFIWRTLMLQDVPNAGFSIGFPNASWTLGADANVLLFTQVVKHMKSHGYSSVVARVEEANKGMSRVPTLYLSSTYFTRSAHMIPKAGDKGPWQARKSYLRDLFWLSFGSITDGLEYVKA